MAKKGLKVTNISRGKKIGVAAESLDEFLKKSCEKLMVKDKWQSCKCYVADDGTLVDDDDYFDTLPAQTLLVVVQPDETMKTEFEYLYDTIRSTTADYLKAGGHAQEFLNDNIDEKLMKIKEHLLNSAPQSYRKSEYKKLLSKIDEDPEWFEGIDTNDETKEAFMSRKSKDRVKGYFYKTKQLLITSEIYVNSKQGKFKTEIDIFIENLRHLLVANKYHKTYFDRSSDKDERLCNNKGQFECGGLWNEDTCKYLGSHAINPYGSREERILFQTWNLDHRIELSRSIVPNILQAVQIVHKFFGDCYSCGGKAHSNRVSANWYYKELFTVDNLKLVHIVCHDKAKHDARSDAYIVCERCWKNETSISRNKN